MEEDSMARAKSVLWQIVSAFILPLLVGIFPGLFHYGNNSRVLLISSLGRLIILLVGISFFVYIIFLLAYKLQAHKAAIGATVFLIFFHTYGSVFDQLRQFDVFKVEHYMLLPAYIILGIYLNWIFTRLSENHLLQLWKATSIIFSLLIIFNLVKIFPVEIRKINNTDRQTTSESNFTVEPNHSAYPDVYYIVFDEMVGFEAIRQYWKYQGINNFVAYLESKGFYVAESSHGSSDNTYHELASRMDYEAYPYDPSKFQKYWDEALDHLSNNKVLPFFKSLGYSTVVFDEGLPITTKFQADEVYTSSLNEMLSWGSVYDEFGLLVLNNTMLEPFVIRMMKNNSANTDHERMLVFAADRIGNLAVPSPKFVYVHLLIPHMPFLFNENGARIDIKNQYDWDQYLGYYIFSTHYAETMIEKILAKADPALPPVIIFQSDHGARNRSMESGNILLQNYPQEYLTLIVNALNLPGCDASTIPQDVNPIDTFPIIFNCYFDAGLPLH